MTVGCPMDIEVSVDSTGSMGDNVDRAMAALPRTYELCAAMLPGYDPQLALGFFGDVCDEFVLNRPGIDEAVEVLDKWLKRAGISKSSEIRIRLAMEELLLRIYEHYDGEIVGELQTKRGLGTTRFIISYKEEAYNPISRREEQDDTVFPEIMARLGLQPEWSYKKGTNRILFRCPGRTIRMEALLVGAVLLAVLSGILAPGIPGGLRSGLLEYLYDPVSETFMDALNTFIGFMILFTILGGICSIGSVADFSRMGKRIIFRMIGLTFVETALCFALMLPFFNIGTGNAAGGVSLPLLRRAVKRLGR